MGGFDQKNNSDGGGHDAARGGGNPGQVRPGKQSLAEQVTLPSPAITPPIGGINKVGFIDNGDGAHLRTGPAESGGRKIRNQPLPPAMQVFVSGSHPAASAWWYVTAYVDGVMVRGYLQDFRVITELPEPTAKLHQVVSGETAEQLAVHEYGNAVRDGHDLRYYENVLLYVNQQQGRAGITGSYQDPGLLTGSGNHVRLVAGHRIWLVSPAYAKALESIVPSGSFTGGAVAKVNRFVGHLEDILHSVTRSPQHFAEVAGAYAQSIRDHLPEIVGIVAGFIMAEATSAFLAATPTGVGQIAAAVIQLGLSAFGAAGAIQAGAEALKHASAWLMAAWTAKGQDDRIALASKEFLQMLVSIAVAALSALGAKANYGNAIKIASSMPTAGLPALAVTGGGRTSDAGAATSVLINPGPGSLGVAGTAMMNEHGQGTGGADTGRGRLIVPEGRVLSAEERAVAEQLVAEGHTVEALAESTTRTADFLVDGVRTELKTISNITSPDPSGALARRILDGAGQAPQIIADLRQQPGMTLELALRAARRAYGADRGGRITSIRLLGAGFDETVPRLAPSGS